MLDSSQVSPHRRSRSMNVGDVSGIGGSVDSGSFEKVEKTKVMLGIESKLMKAIKEVRSGTLNQLGGNSQNFLQKFVIFIVTLDLKILRLNWLNVVFEADIIIILQICVRSFVNSHPMVLNVWQLATHKTEYYTIWWPIYYYYNHSTKKPVLASLTSVPLTQKWVTTQLLRNTALNDATRITLSVSRSYPN